MMPGDQHKRIGAESNPAFRLCGPSVIGRPE